MRSTVRDEFEVGCALKLISGNMWETEKPELEDNVCTPMSLSSWFDVMVVASFTALLRLVCRSVRSILRQDEFCPLNSDPQQWPELRLSSLVSLTEDTSGGNPSKPEWSSDR